MDGDKSRSYETNDKFLQQTEFRDLCWFGIALGGLIEIQYSIIITEV